MARLWQVEEKIRGQECSAVIVTELLAFWLQTLPRISAQSDLAEAIHYAISRRGLFERFLTDGRIDLGRKLINC